MRGCFGSWKIQSGPSVFHIGPLHGLIWPRCKGQISPKFWYQNSPISIGLNWPQKQYRSGLTRFGPIFGAELALFILQCTYKYLPFVETASSTRVDFAYFRARGHSPSPLRHFCFCTVVLDLSLADNILSSKPVSQRSTPAP